MKTEKLEIYGGGHLGTVKTPGTYEEPVIVPPDQFGRQYADEPTHKPGAGEPVIIPEDQEEREKQRQKELAKVKTEFQDADLEEEFCNE